MPQIPGLPAAGTFTSGDLIPMSQGGSAKRTALGVLLAPGGGTATAVVYSSQFPTEKLSALSAAAWTWICDGTSDQAEINAAITAVAVQGGGRVALLGDTFSIDGPIQMRTGVWVQGEGLGAMVKAATAIVGGGMVTLYDDTVHATKLSDLTLDGGGLDVGAGLYYSATGGQVFSGLPSTQPDAAHIVSDLFIRAVGTASVAGHGMRLRGANLRACKYTNIRIQGATGCGVWIDSSVDSHYVNVEIGSSGASGPAVSTTSTAPVGHGFYVSTGENNFFTACKAWYSRGVGFYVRTTRSHFLGCQAQDNYGHGFHLAFGKCTYASCIADSNGQGGVASAGFYIASEASTLVGCMGIDRGGQSWTQAYGFQWTSAFTNGRIVGGIAYGNATSATTGTLGSGSTADVAAA